MVNENIKLITENKKPFETVQELKNEVPSFEEFMETYERDEKLNNNYELEVDSYGDIGVERGYGPTYTPHLIVSESGQQIPRVDLNSTFSIEYRVTGGKSFSKHFFHLGHEEYSTMWRISGNLEELRRELDKIKNREIQVVKVCSSGNDYQRVRDLEEEVKRELEKTIEGFELAVRNGSRILTHKGGEFHHPNAYNNICYKYEQTSYSYN